MAQRATSAPLADGPKIIVALNVANGTAAVRIAEKLNPAECRVKVGIELFSHGGPPVVKSLAHMGFDVFLDLKYHDLPNTVEKSVRAAADLGAWMVSVHTLGGRKMLQSAANGAKASRKRSPIVIGATVLTSLQDSALAELGIGGNAQETTTRLAHLAEESGLDGVICSGMESFSLRQKLGNGFLLVTPGIRLAKDGQNDHERVVTPATALKNGADFLIVGRPIVESQNPTETLERYGSAIRKMYRPKPSSTDALAA